MHEHKLARQIFPTLQELAQKNNLKKITKVVIDFGMFHMVEPDFLAHSFEHVFEGTIFEGAKVEANTIEPGQKIEAEDGSEKLATGHEIIIRKIEGQTEE